MPEQTTLAVSKFLAPMCALAGAILMLLFKREMDVRRMVLAVISAPFFAALLTPMVVAWLSSLMTWMPTDWSVVGAVGSLIGMLAINIIAVVAHLGERAETVVPNAALPKEDKNV